MQSPPSPSGPFPGSSATGGSEHHILWPVPRKTGALPRGKQAQGAGRQPRCPGWPRPPHQGLPTSWWGAMLGCWYPSGLPWEQDVTLLFGWQRDKVERGKCPGEKMSKSRKLVWALRAKSENSVVSPAHVSPRPPQPAATKDSPKQSPSLTEGASFPCHPAAAMWAHTHPCTLGWVVPAPPFWGACGGCSLLLGPLNRHPHQGNFSVEFHKEAHDEGSWKPQLCEC